MTRRAGRGYHPLTGTCRWKEATTLILYLVSMPFLGAALVYASGAIHNAWELSSSVGWLGLSVIALVWLLFRELERGVR